MPIQLPGIPSRPNPVKETLDVDPRSAAAPGMAIAQSLAGSLGDVAGDLKGYAMQVADIENWKTMEEARGKMRNGYKQWQVEAIENNIQPGDLKGSWESRAQELKADVMEGVPMTQAARDRLGPEWQEFYDSRQIDVAEDSVLEAIRQSNSTYDDLRGQAHEDGDADEADRLLESYSFNLPDDVVGIHQRENAQLRDDVMKQGEMIRDPLKYIEGHPAPADGQTPGQHMQDIREAQNILRQQTGQDTDAAIDSILTKDITTADQIDKRYPLMREASRQKLKDLLGSYQTGELQEQQQSPEAQNKLVGEINAKTEAYDPHGVGVDYGIVELETLLEGVGNKSMRDELQRQIDRKRAGETFRVETMADLGREALKRASKAGELGQVKPSEVEIPLERLVVDGLLDDEAKLQAAGMPEKVAKKVAKVSGVEEKVTAFREAWKDSRGFADASLSEFDRRAMQAIVAGKEGFILGPDPDFDPAPAEASMGRAMGEYEKWLSVTSDPSAEDIEKKVSELTGNEVSLNIKSQAPQRPQRNSMPPQSSTRGGPMLPLASALPAPMQSLAPAFEKYGREYGIDPRFLAAISQLETGSGTSSAFRNKNNAMGVSPGGKGPRRFNTKEESIEYMAKRLASSSGPYKGASTLAEIAAIYSPPGAGNDPHGTNSYWPKGVGKFLRGMGVDPNSSLVTR